jgi:ankyrin repeat protein
MLLSVAVWLFGFEIVAGFVPIHIKGGICECRRHYTAWNISFFVFAAAAILWGALFSIFLNRLVLVASAKPGDKFLPLSRISRAGRALLGWLGIPVLAVIVGAYLYVDYCSSSAPDRMYPAHESLTEVLHCAALRGDISTARAVLDRGIFVNSDDGNLNIPLHWAALRGDVEMARLLIDRGANVNALGFRSNTPLLLAAEKGHNDVAALLIDRGASVDIRNEEGRSPLHLAARDGHAHMVTLLVEKGTDVDIRCGSHTPLFFAAARGRVKAAQALIEKGADVNVRDSDGQTPMHLAFDGTAVGLLVKAGADVNAVDDFDMTPLDVALSRRRGDKMAAFLRTNGGKTGEELRKEKK